MTPLSTAQGPGRRRGPRPLLLHLALATMRAQAARQSSKPAWPSLNDAWQQHLASALSAVPASTAEIGPDAALIAGIAAYRRHGFVRSLPEPPTVWREGASSMLDFGGDGGPVMLIVPSLVNRATILDLCAGASMARYLCGRGLRVKLLDWGWPGPEERAMGLDALISGRLMRAIQAAGPRVVLVGYCMGGLLAMAAAQLNPKPVAALALLATPWDFHAGDREVRKNTTTILAALEPVMAASGAVPVDVLQCLFSLSDPHAVGDKFRSFGRMDQTSARAQRFVAMEDWLADGVPLAAPVARDCIGGWYRDNAPAHLAWSIGGQIIDPSHLAMPLLVAVPDHDSVVPPESAMALARLLPAATLLRPASGHIGMIAGSRAEQDLWAPLADWALRVGAKQTRSRRRR